jgi:hypothetical protein
MTQVEFHGLARHALALSSSTPRYPCLREGPPGFWSSMARQNSSGEKRSGDGIHIGEPREATGTPR